MAYKMFRKGGYFYIVDTSAANREYSQIATEVQITRSTDASTSFYVKNVPNFTTDAIALANIQDENGTAYVLADFVKFYQQVGSVDVNIQDSDSPLLIMPMTKNVADTTTTGAVAVDDTVIPVADATGFAVGQILTIFNVAADRITYGKILSIATLDITIDTPLDYAYPSGSIVTVGADDMAVDGSVTPQIFGIRNPDTGSIGSTYDVTRIIIKMLCATALDLSKFGDIAGGITKGIVLRKKDGEYRNIFNAKTNGDLKNLMFDFSIEAASGSQQDGATGRLTFGGQEKLGAVIRLAPDEDLQLIIQDNLSTLSTMRVYAQGSLVVD